MLVSSVYLFFDELIMELEKIFSVACYGVGAVFFFIALFGAWPHFFTMSICLASGILISEDRKSATD